MQNLIMNYPAAARNGVSIGIVIISPKGGELNLYPPQEGLSAVFLADLSAVFLAACLPPAEEGICALYPFL